MILILNLLCGNDTRQWTKRPQYFKATTNRLQQLSLPINAVVGMNLCDIAAVFHPVEIQEAFLFVPAVQ